MSLNRQLLTLSYLVLVIPLIGGKYFKPTVYQKIRQSPRLSQFYNLLEANRQAKLNLQYGEMTVFAPTNEAFEWYSGGNLQEVLDYHMVWYAKAKSELHSGPLLTLKEGNPPLWVTRLEDDVFINNARLVPEVSDYTSEIHVKTKKPQVLHVVDEVLDPVFKRSSHSHAAYNPSAWDLLARPQLWDLGHHKVELFARKVNATRKSNLFKSEGNFTFFVPVNEGFTDYRLQMLDGNAIEGHVVNRVLFTRPTSKDSPFETVARDDYLHVVVVLSGVEGRLFAKSHTLVGNANHPMGEIAAEIVKANIPVKNGVVHLIRRPLVVFDRKLTRFPYLPVLDKVSMDPTLDRTYSLGEATRFNELLKSENYHFTYFVPRDKAWGNLQSFLGVNNSFFGSFVADFGKAILCRHMIVSNTSYTIEDLRRKSNVSDTADVDIKTLGGVLKVGIGASDGEYMIYWRNKMIKVYRPNYFCTNGIVHVVDDLFVNEEDLHPRTGDSNEISLLEILNILLRYTP